MKPYVDIYKKIIGEIHFTIILHFILMAFGLYIAFEIVKEVIHYVRRKSIVIDYNLKMKDVPGFFEIRIKKTQGRNYFILAYPRWESENRDRSCDKRFRDNCIVWRPSYLYLDQYVISSTRPYNMVILVNKIRKRNPDLEIELCHEEERKGAKIYRMKERIQQCESIQGIIDSFSDDPFEFEKFIAKLYQKMGYDAECTPKTNDGGFDIKLRRHAETGIVECKCYAQKIRIGRPAIQKLVGANQMEKADRMIFVTTSDYSQEAKEYAENAGVELLNGKNVLALTDYHYADRKLQIKINKDEIRLTRKEIERFYPPDI